MVHLMKEHIGMQNSLITPIASSQLPDFPAIRPEHVLPAIDELLKNYHQGIEAWLQGGSSAG